MTTEPELVTILKEWLKLNKHLIFDGWFVSEILMQYEFRRLSLNLHKLNGWVGGIYDDEIIMYYNKTNYTVKAADPDFFKKLEKHMVAAKDYFNTMNWYHAS